MIDPQLERLVVIRKGTSIYVIVFERGHEARVLEQLIERAADDSLNFTVQDLACISARIMKGEEQRFELRLE